MAEDRRLDGNAIGGMLLELFGVEMTSATEVCRTCGTADVVARLEVYMDAPGHFMVDHYLSFHAPVEIAPPVTASARATLSAAAAS